MWLASFDGVLELSPRNHRDRAHDASPFPHQTRARSDNVRSITDTCEGWTTARMLVGPGATRPRASDSAGCTLSTLRTTPLLTLPLHVEETVVVHVYESSVHYFDRSFLILRLHIQARMHRSFPVPSRPSLSRPSSVLPHHVVRIHVLSSPWRPNPDPDPRRDYFFRFLRIRRLGIPCRKPARRRICKGILYRCKRWLMDSPLNTVGNIFVERAA